jgi:hypothetical protein
MARGLFEIVEEKIGARRMLHRGRNNGLCEKYNGETIEQQSGTRGPGTFSRAASTPSPRPFPEGAGRGPLITFCCLQIVADSGVGQSEF